MKPQTQSMRLTRIFLPQSGISFSFVGHQFTCPQRTKSIKHNRISASISHCAVPGQKGCCCPRNKVKRKRKKENDCIAQPKYVVNRSENFKSHSEKKSKTTPFDSIRFVRPTVKRGRAKDLTKSMRQKQIRFHFVLTS
jgi:hypothetical protein